MSAIGKADSQDWPQSWTGFGGRRLLLARGRKLGREMGKRAAILSVALLTANPALAGRVRDLGTPLMALPSHDHGQLLSDW